MNMSEIEYLKELREIVKITQCKVNRYKWRNIIFSKSGQSYKGINLWDSREEADEPILRELKFVENSGFNEGWFWPTQNGDLLIAEYSWHMQIPEVE